LGIIFVFALRRRKENLEICLSWIWWRIEKLQYVKRIEKVCEIL